MIWFKRQTSAAPNLRFRFYLQRCGWQIYLPQFYSVLITSYLEYFLVRLCDMKGEMRSEKRVAEEYSSRMRTSVKIFISLVLLLLALDAVHVRFSLHGLEKRLTSRINILAEKETDILKRLANCEYQVKGEQMKWLSLEFRKQLRKTREVNEGDDQSLLSGLKAIHTSLGKLLSRDTTVLNFRGNNSVIC